MTQDLIHYPALDYDAENGWRDTGEGGQFFYAVWNNAQRAECSVDAFPTLHMADVLVAAHGPLTEEFRAQRETWYAKTDRGSGWNEAYAASGVNFDTVLQLGTTPVSYFYDDYFQIRSVEDLTEAGRAIVDAISAAMGSEPTFVSYLDT